MLGLVVAPLANAAGPSKRLLPPRTSTPMDMPDGMPCCPDMPAKPDCAKDCPLMAVCAGTGFSTPTGRMWDLGDVKRHFTIRHLHPNRLWCRRHRRASILSAADQKSPFARINAPLEIKTLAVGAHGARSLKSCFLIAISGALSV